MNVDAYLTRIGYTGPRTPDATTLAALHHAHILAVPFENLDIGLGRPITLDLPSRYAKIVTRRRGGFCYELNGLFAWLLQQLGYGVTLLSAGVYGGDGAPGPDYDHLTLLVRCPGDPTPWLADVGFGEGFREPLRLDVADAQTRHGRQYRLAPHPGPHPGPHPNPLPEGEGEEVRPLSPWERSGEGLHVSPLAPWERSGEGGRWLYCEGDRAGGWTPRYWFTLTPRRFADFAAMCQWQQTSPESHFTRRRVCSLATPEGRVTLADMTLIVTERGERHETPVADAAEYHHLLRERFGVDLSL